MLKILQAAESWPTQGQPIRRDGRELNLEDAFPLQTNWSLVSFL